MQVNFNKNDSRLIIIYVDLFLNKTTYQGTFESCKDFCRLSGGLLVDGSSTSISSILLETIIKY